MTDEQILTKALQKAIDNGWEYGRGWLHLYPKFDETGDYDARPDLDDLEKIIFDHEFAKAFWGNPDIAGAPNTSGWQYHLQQMVLEKDPIKYLGKHL